MRSLVHILASNSTSAIPHSVHDTIVITGPLSILSSSVRESAIAPPAATIEADKTAKLTRRKIGIGGNNIIA